MFGETYEMIITIISWAYIFIISAVTGLVVNRLLSKLIPVPAYDDRDGHFGITGLCVTGLVALTVYAEVFSIFYKVGAVCHVFMLLAVAVGAFFYRTELGKLIEMIRKQCTKAPFNAVALFILIVLAAAFFSGLRLILIP